MIAGFDLADQRQRHRGHAGRGGACGFGALEGCHPPLEHVDGRIGKTRILIAGVLALEARLRLGRIVIDIALRQIKRLGRLAEGRTQRARLHQTGLGTIDFFCGRGHVALLKPAFSKRPPANENIGQKKTRPGGQSSRPGSHVPGLLANCFTWLQAGRLK